MTVSSAPRGRSGRRPGPTQSREAIARAARAQFAELGYDRATFRGIAAAAGVDPALVVHFFGSKDAAVPRGDGAAARRSPTRSRRWPEVPRDEVGRRLAELIVGAAREPGDARDHRRPDPLGRLAPARGRARARDGAARHPTADSAIDDDRPDTRAVLVGAQIVGIAFARYVVHVEPLASMPRAELVDLLAPMFQPLLVEPLGA